MEEFSHLRSWVGAEVSVRMATSGSVEKYDSTKPKQRKKAPGGSATVEMYPAKLLCTAGIAGASPPEPITLGSRRLQKGAHARHSNDHNDPNDRQDRAHEGP